MDFNAGDLVEVIEGYGKGIRLFVADEPRLKGRHKFQVKLSMSCPGDWFTSLHEDKLKLITPAPTKFKFEVGELVEVIKTGVRLYVGEVIPAPCGNFCKLLRYEGDSDGLFHDESTLCKVTKE